MTTTRSLCSCGIIRPYGPSSTTHSLEIVKSTLILRPPGVGVRVVVVVVVIEVVLVLSVLVVRVIVCSSTCGNAVVVVVGTRPTSSPGSSSLRAKIVEVSFGSFAGVPLTETAHAGGTFGG